MREVTIPNDYNPFRLEVNGRIYSYKAGTTQSVPDEVAELIDMYNQSKPVPKENSIIDNNGLGFQKTDADKVLKVKEDGSDVEWAEGGLDIPEYTAEDAGKALKVNQDGVGIGWHEDIYDNTKNLFRNGKPTFSMNHDTQLSIATGLEPWRSWTLARGSNTNSYEWGDGLPYFHFTYEASKTTSQSTMQLQKNYKASGNPENTGKELESLIPGADVTLSFEIKSTIAFNLRTRMDAKNLDNTRIMRILYIDRNYETALADWTKVTVTDVVPYNFKDLFFSENTKDAFFMIQTKFIDDAHRANGDIYLRNIKLEYGKEATPYTYADIDQRLIDYYIDSKLSNLVVYVNDTEWDGENLVNGTLSRTWNEINNALRSGIPVTIVLTHDLPNGPKLTRVLTIDSAFGGAIPGLGYKIEVLSGLIFTTDTADGYPMLYAD